jgi:hypothetical protein
MALIPQARFLCMILDGIMPSPFPVSRARSEPRLEVPRKDGRAREAALHRYFSDRKLVHGPQKDGRFFQAKPVNVIGRSLTHHGAEDMVKMVGRKTGFAGDVGELQVAGQV